MHQLRQQKPHKEVLGYAVLEIGVCFGVLNGMKGQIIQREAVMSDIELSLNIFCEWLQTRKHGKNERAWTQNNQRHEGT